MSEPTSLHDTVLLLQCNLDDMTGEALAFVLDRVLAEGALDAWFTPIYMKKSRPATMLSVLCRPEDGSALRQLMLRETTTLGVRWQEMEREVAGRQTVQVQSPWGLVRCKLKTLAGKVVSVKPEFDDCARLAGQHQVPLDQVIAAVRDCAMKLVGRSPSAD